MDTEIYEDGKLQYGGGSYTDLMTPKQKRRGSYYSQQYFLRRAELEAAYKQLWDDLQKLYECRRDPVSDDENFPCNFIPILTPTIEGQVASMMESKIDFRHISNAPGSEVFMKQLDAASEYYRTKNKAHLHFKDFARFYDLLGNAWIKISWDKCLEKKKGFPEGLPRLSVRPLLSVLVDGRIKDVKDLQYADYIIDEMGYQSISWARKEYGDEYADALCAQFNRAEGDQPDHTVDDSKTFTLLEVWTRDNDEGNLQRILMDVNGLIFEESDSSKPFYETVGNEYPFGMARMIPQMGKFYGMGDGVILQGIQEGVNNLADELEVGARYSAQTKIAVDQNAGMAAEQYNSNPADIMYCTDPKNNILPLPGLGVNPVIMQTMAMYLSQAQYATRFHESMTGNISGSSATATQINTQITQGHVGVKDKKTDLSAVMAWADMYALKLCLQYWDKPFWAAMGDGSHTFVDPAAMSRVPALIPTTGSKIKELLGKITGSFSRRKETPSPFQSAEDEHGEMLYTDLEFRTDVIIGEAIPKGRIDMYNILLGLAQVRIIDPQTGQQRNLISPKRMQQIMEDLLGIKLMTADEEQSQDLSGMAFDPMAISQQNPVGQGTAAQTPVVGRQTPDNLQQTVTQMPNADSRKVVM